MRIAYGKLGRSIPLTLADASNIGGDIEVVRLLDVLRLEHEVHLVGRNRADVRLTNVVNHWLPDGTFGSPPKSAARSFEDPEYQRYRAWVDERARSLPKFDAWVLWLGQHGSSVHPVPAVQDGKRGTYTNPLASDINYGFPVVHAVNVSEVKPIWLCPDPRNMVKFRDLWDPQQRTFLAQYDTSKANTFYDERDGKLREGRTRYRYAGIELLAVPHENDALPVEAPPLPFGVLVNEGRTDIPNCRRDLVKQWLARAPEWPAWEIFGHWTEASQRELGREIYPVSIADVPSTLRRWRATITFPATNTGWATAKPWECFSAGTICFRHPKYDDQRHIYGRDMPDELRSFLCPYNSLELRGRVEELKDDAVWRRYATLQLAYLQASRIRLGNGAAELWKELGCS